MVASVPSGSRSSPAAGLDDIADRLGSHAARSVPLAPYTTFRVGGPAELATTAENIGDLLTIREALLSHPDVDVLVIGQGSNLLVADDGFPGLVVLLGHEFAEIEILPGSIVRAGAAVKLPVLARKTVSEGLTGLEWAVGVPGSVGGGVRMNAGGHGSDMAASLAEIDVVYLRGSAARESIPTERLGLAYRRSLLGPTDIVVAATFSLRPGNAEAGAAELAEIVRWRREHQPGGANCGSVFTNPPGDAAGRLIDVAGCKGMRYATASVSPKHANFIQADEGGRAADVWALIMRVREIVFAKFAVVLNPEVRTAGFDASLPQLPPNPSHDSPSSGQL